MRKASGEKKQKAHKSIRIRFILVFLRNTMETRKLVKWILSEYRIYFPKENNPRVLYPAKLLLKCKARKMIYSDIQGLRKFTAQKVSLKALLLKWNESEKYKNCIIPLTYGI